MALLLEAPFGPEFGPRRGLAVDEAEGGVVVGRGGEGVVEGEIEGGVGGVFRAGGVVEVASPIGDSAELVGAREWGVGDVDGEVGGGLIDNENRGSE